MVPVRRAARTRPPFERPRALEVGDCLGATFETWWRNLPAFLVISFLVYSPLLVYTWFELAPERTAPAFRVEASPWGGRRVLETSPLSCPAIARWATVTQLGGILLGLVVSGAICFGVVMHLRRTPAGLGACLKVGFRRLPPVLGIMGLFLVPVVVVAVVLVLVALASPILASLLMLAAVVVGSIAYCAVWVSVPAAVVERPGVRGAIRRSLALTRGSKLAIFGVVLVLGIVGAVPGLVLENAVLGRPANPEQYRFGRLATLFVGQVLLGTLTSVACAIAYHRLRQGREGASVDDLAKVFA